MCQALEELMKDRIDEKVNDATINARIADIKTLMDSVKWTAEQAMDALQIPADERSTYNALL